MEFLQFAEKSVPPAWKQVPTWYQSLRVTAWSLLLSNTCSQNRWMLLLSHFRLAMLIWITSTGDRPISPQCNRKM